MEINCSRRNMVIGGLLGLVGYVVPKISRAEIIQPSRLRQYYKFNIGDKVIVNVGRNRRLTNYPNQHKFIGKVISIQSTGELSDIHREVYGEYWGKIDANCATKRIYYTILVLTEGIVNNEKWRCPEGSLSFNEK